MDRTLENVLEKHGEVLKDFVHRTQEKMGEQTARLMDVEQKLARRPGSYDPFGEAASGPSLGARLTEHANLQLLRSGDLKSARFRFELAPLETKAMIANSGQIMTAADRRPEIVAPATRRPAIRDLLPIVAVTGNTLEVTRETSFTNNAAPQYEASPMLTEGALKPESALAFSLLSAPIVTVAHWTSASRQVLADNALLLDFVSRRLLYGLQLEEDRLLLNGSGTSGEPSGLLLSGNFTQYNRSTSADTRADTLRRAMTQLQLAYHTPTGIVLSPGDWETIQLQKDTTGQYLIGQPTGANAATLWNTPVLPTAAMTAGTFLVADFQALALLAQRLEAVVEIGTRGDDFIANRVTILAEERIGLAVTRPTASVAGSF